MKIVIAACQSCGREQEFDVVDFAHCKECGALQDRAALADYWDDQQADEHPLPTKEHLGDGAYVEIKDGMFKLTAMRGYDEHFIFLGPCELAALKAYEERVMAVLKARRQE